MWRKWFPALTLIVCLGGCTGSGPGPGPDPAPGKKTTLIVINSYTVDALSSGKLKELVVEGKPGLKLVIDKLQFVKAGKEVATPPGFPPGPYYELKFDHRSNKSETFPTIFYCPEDLPQGTKFTNFKLVGFANLEYTKQPLSGKADDKQAEKGFYLAPAVWEANVVTP